MSFEVHPFPGPRSYPSECQDCVAQITKLVDFDLPLLPRGLHVGEEVAEAILAAIDRPLQASDERGPHLDVHGDHMDYGFDVAPGVGGEQSSDDLDVLLRHRPPSIPREGEGRQRAREIRKTAP